MTTSSQSTPAPFAEWAIVEVMGHNRYIGHVTEHVIAGQGFVRLDVPATTRSPRWTKLIGTGSIYAITPIEESIARAMVEQSHQAPISAFELRQLGLPSPADSKPVRTPEQEFEDLAVDNPYDRERDEDEYY